MLDIRFIRQNRKLVKEAVRKKQINLNIDRLLELDQERRTILQEIEKLRKKRNLLSQQKPTEKQIQRGKELKKAIKKLEREWRRIEVKFKNLMLQVPQIPAKEVPEGKSEVENKPIRFWGEKPKFNFPPKSHIELGKSLDLIDFQRGAKVSGFRGYFLKNEAVLLAFGLWDLALRLLIKKGFTPLQAPVLVKEFSLIGTGWLPLGKKEVYTTKNNLFLAGTAEIPVTAYHAGEILREEELPKKYAAFSPCFRTEAGSYGKDTKGIYRLHEFMKVEQVIICKAEEGESIKWHEEITKNAEELLQILGLPYRVVINCSGDLGLGQVKKYDIECWIPSQNRYRETHSSSYFFDFQTRRLNIRYRTKKGEIKFAHSLNNTMIATPRILIPILENYQEKGGIVKVPAVLEKYVGKKILRPPTNHPLPAKTLPGQQPS